VFAWFRFAAWFFAALAAGAGAEAADRVRVAMPTEGFLYTPVYLAIDAGYTGATPTGGGAAAAGQAWAYATGPVQIRLSEIYLNPPTLAEALGLLRDRARAMIEVKTESVTADEAGGVEALTVSEIRRLGMADKVALISFDQRAILRLRRLAPEISRGRIFGRATADEVVDAARASASEIVMPHKSQLDERLGREQRRDVLQRLELLLDRGDDARLAVAEADCHDSAEEVEILLALGIEQPLAFTADEGQRFLVVGRKPVQILAVLRDDLGLVHGCTRGP